MRWFNYNWIFFSEFADFKLCETPGDDVLKALSYQIGNCALQLGIELGVTLYGVENSFIKFPKDLPGLLEDILKKWKNESKVATFYSLMMALKLVNGGGVRYLRKLLSWTECLGFLKYYLLCIHDRISLYKCIICLYHTIFNLLYIIYYFRIP